MYRWFDSGERQLSSGEWRVESDQMSEAREFLAELYRTSIRKSGSRGVVCSMLAERYRRSMQSVKSSLAALRLRGEIRAAGKRGRETVYVWVGE